MTIMANSIREKLRRKDMYVVLAISMILLLLFSTSNGTLTINGVPITDYRALLPILLVFVNTIGGMIALTLSLRTIPNEYERKTSHLILIRGVSQIQYHMQLAFANVISAAFATGILYLGIVFFLLNKGEASLVIRIIPAYLVLCISTAIISLFTTVISIKMSTMGAGAIAATFFLIGIFHGLIDTVANTISGFSSICLKAMLYVIPNLNELQSQAGNILLNKPFEIHPVLGGLLACYLISILYFIWKRKEV